MAVIILEIPGGGFFENPTSYGTRSTYNKFTDGGVVDRRRDGINSVANTRRVKGNIVGYSAKAALENTLKNAKGMDYFKLDFHLDKTETDMYYHCKEFSFRRLGRDVYEFSGLFESIYLP